MMLCEGKLTSHPSRKAFGIDFPGYLPIVKTTGWNMHKEGGAVSAPPTFNLASYVLGS